MIRFKAPDGDPGRFEGKFVAASFALGDAAAAAWLWFCLLRFRDIPVAFWPSALAPALALPLVAHALGLHRFRRRGAASVAARTLAVGALLSAAGALAASRGWLAISPCEAAWVAVAGAFLVWLQRAAYFGAWDDPPSQPWEALRWLAIGAAGTWIMYPFYRTGSLGAGDAHWYSVMLSDFLAQSRAGIFPVWVGQSVSAFNGAVSPLRYAPGFQYLGGIVDVLTAGCLEPMAVQNATLAVASLLGAASAYCCLRSVAPGRPWVACGLALLWILGPGIWAPALVGDQYMTFVSIPFVPLILYGCWRVWSRDDGWARFWISAGLAGCWICHSPVALWMTLIAAMIYLWALLARRQWRRESSLIAFMAGAFAALGSLPFISVLTLDDQIKIHSSAAYAVDVIRKTFPANFSPIRLNVVGLADYQAGYALLAALGFALLLLLRYRPRGAWSFVAATLVLVPFFVPVPWLTLALWNHVPGWFVTVQNVWPMQRLFLVWSSLIVFVAAIEMGARGAPPAAWRRAALAVAFLGAAGWSVSQAHRVLGSAGGPSAGETRMKNSPDNLILTRYAYSSFEYSPAYFSHSYMEPWFENRLLDAHTLEPVESNADAAAPEPASADAAGAGARLVQSGTLTAEEILDTSNYHLLPVLTLQPGRHYALRLDFIDPARAGTLQLMQPSLFREYEMPDSGAGINRADESVPSLAFGSGPTNSHVVPMIVSGPGPYAINAMFLSNTPAKRTYPFATFALYTYSRADLPVNVRSWMPYRAGVAAKEPCYLETPRMWLKGWRATVNGRPAETLRSPENLVMIPLQAGSSDVGLDYSPPPALAASFWLSAASWLVLASLGLVQLALFTGGSRLVAETDARPPRRWVPKAAVAALAVLAGAAAAVGVARGRRMGAPSVPASAGPVRIEFRRPYREIGHVEPLLSTGHPNAGTIVFIRFLDRRHVSLGADIWGSLHESGPIDMDYNRTESLVVSDSALFPVGDPAVARLAPAEAAALRGRLILELNGKRVLEVPGSAYETLPSEILVGRSQFGSVAEKAFAGDILGAQRLALPRTATLPVGRHARLRARFPVGETGQTQPLLVSRAGADRLVWGATYLGAGHLRLGCTSSSGESLGAAEVAYDPSRTHDMDFGFPGSSPSLWCTFDGTRLVALERQPPGPPPVLASGVDAAGTPGIQARFTGPLLDMELVPDAGARPGAAPGFGAVHLLLRLPSDKGGRGEPLLASGRAGKGDFVYLSYTDATHVRIGYDHWAYGGFTTDPIAIDYAVPHEVWIRLGPLYPAAQDAAGWGSLAPSLRAALKGTVSVILDGKTVVSSRADPFPASPSEVTVGENRIGGSTCDAAFTGTIEFSERAEPPAGAK
jgi:hypothetical protein